MNAQGLDRDNHLTLPNFKHQTSPISYVAKITALVEKLRYLPPQNTNLLSKPFLLFF